MVTQKTRDHATRPLGCEHPDMVMQKTRDHATRPLCCEQPDMVTQKTRDHATRAGDRERAAQTFAASTSRAVAAMCGAVRPYFSSSAS